MALIVQGAGSSEDFLKELKADIQESADILSDKINATNKDFTWVLLIGMTGAGKTTLLNVLSGITLTVAEDAITKCLHLVDSNGGSNSVISYGTRSETFIPNICVDEKDEIVFFDCPGFLDTQPKRRLINSFLIDQVLANARKVKVLLVLDEKELTYRAVDARNSIELLTKMFTNEEDLKKALGIVVTKVGGRMIPQGLLKRLADSDDNYEISGLINTVIQNSEKRVFEFPEPYDAPGVVGSVYTSFKDKEDIFAFLKHNPVLSPSHQPVVDDKTLVMLMQVSQMFNADMAKALSGLACGIDEATNNLNKEGEMKKWIDLVCKLKSAAKNGWNEFIYTCRNLCSKEQELKRPVQEIEKLFPWIEFITRVMSSNKQLLNGGNSPAAPLQAALRECDVFIERLNSKINSAKSEKRMTELQTEMSGMKRQYEQQMSGMQRQYEQQYDTMKSQLKGYRDEIKDLKNKKSQEPQVVHHYHESYVEKSVCTLQ